MLILIAICSLTLAWLILRKAQLKGETIVSSDVKQIVVITGCDSGIGLELAKYIHGTTNYTVMCGFLKSGGGQQELLAMSKNNDRMIPCNLDIRSDDDIEALKSQLNNLKRDHRMTRLAALINNAGVMAYGEFDWLTWNQIESQIEVNLVGTIRLTRALLPQIIEGKGRIINISSVNDKTVFPGLSIYSATKSALSTFSRGLGYELRKFGASVVTLRLGDFARLTNIMSGHANHRDSMREEMDADKQALYGDYFNEFHEHLMTNYGMTSPRHYRNSSLFDDLRLALMSKQPPNTITCAPLKYKLFYAIIEHLPIWLQYCLLDVLFQFAFKWKPTAMQPDAHKSSLNSN